MDHVNEFCHLERKAIVHRDSNPFSPIRLKKVPSLEDSPHVMASGYVASGERVTTLWVENHMRGTGMQPSTRELEGSFTWVRNSKGQHGFVWSRYVHPASTKFPERMAMPRRAATPLCPQCGHPVQPQWVGVFGNCCSPSCKQQFEWARDGVPDLWRKLAERN